MSRSNDVPLSQSLSGERAPDTCQCCSRKRERIKAVGGHLTLWQECDLGDTPTGTYVLLCEACNGDPENQCSDSDLIDAKVKRRLKTGIVERHSHLYHRVDDNAPMPGVMWLCTGCVHREGVYCKYTKPRQSRVIHAGEERIKPQIDIIEPARISGRGGRGSWSMLVWPQPARSCSEWESEDGKPFEPRPEPSAEEIVAEWRNSNQANQDHHFAQLRSELRPGAVRPVGATNLEMDFADETEEG